MYYTFISCILRLNVIHYFRLSFILILARMRFMCFILFIMNQYFFSISRAISMTSRDPRKSEKTGLFYNLVSSLLPGAAGKRKL